MEARLVIIGQVHKPNIGQIWFAQSELVQRRNTDGQLLYKYRILEEPLSLWVGNNRHDTLPVLYFTTDGTRLTEVKDLKQLA